MQFIALDLETTGLSPETDTIIEIAAIRFELEKVDGKYEMRNVEERSMLIDPERPLSEEVRMITGISEDMLDGREKWGDVRERVRAFIGVDTVIVGHNVLFDIAMLKTHGTDLSGYTVLDTFELSEIFSQDAESLNLLFLAKKYNLPIEGEHRALDDTRLSVGLFIHYLERFSSLDEVRISLFSFFRDKDTSNILSTLYTITMREYIGGYSLPYISEFLKKSEKPTFPTSSKEEIILSMSPGDSLSSIIDEKIHDGKRLLLITNGKKQSQYWYEKLIQEGYRAELLVDTKRYCSIAGLSDMMNEERLGRKKLIFLIKILFWLSRTKTGLLDELKYYGDEHIFIEGLRCTDAEYSWFRREKEIQIKKANIIIADMWMMELRTQSVLDRPSTTILTDICNIEEIFRKSESKKVSLSSLFQDIGYLSEKNIITVGFRDACIDGISYLQSLIEDIPERPTGDSLFPPGEYGETYYFDQGSLWHRGEKWLSMYMDKIFDAVEESNIADATGYLDRQKYISIVSNLRILIDISTRKNTNIGMILSIQKDDTILNIIPRDMKNMIHAFFSMQSSEELILSGYGIDGPIMSRFLSEQCGIGRKGGVSRKQKTEKMLTVNTDIKSLLEGSPSCLILSGSNKHLRTLSQEVQKYFPKRKIFTQGISGGKGKMMTLFLKETGEKVLLGLLDSWSDEYSVFKNIDTLIIAKVPFDPPTDPYYLARTVGMKNNFEEYSCPLAINTLNTLIGKVCEVNPDINIFCIDNRLTETIWGGKIFDEIL